MEKSKKVSSKSSNDSEAVKGDSVGNSEEKSAGRRLQDTVTLKDSSRKLNLDRRVLSVDRRVDTDPNYKGPARRYTVDSRVKLKDRRDKD